MQRLGKRDLIKPLVLVVYIGYSGNFYILIHVQFLRDLLSYQLQLISNLHLPLYLYYYEKRIVSYQI